MLRDIAQLPDPLAVAVRRGYIGFDFESAEAQLVFIKDLWYPEGMRPELANYALLRQHEVPNVPIVFAGGSVGGDGAQATLNQDSFSDGSSRPWKRIHHRIVMKQIGRRLKYFKDQKELLRCTYHAFRGTSS
ncbi:uncharacterized protein PHACADRAFT_264807 [Phanerochaete carnosa HHB-10118-sp]|uniref:Uncharacterized protein n=1 Tax=Phanerochaete carnosa (strain HHB-10118-sp) TaxID=650164 RepID=K5UKN4_PHACS|nr:uncharacterized protein PHACADRAFT_264807 [Phanerochaete carnosa HHB-10118-sp]EKM50206.1 hypothetical protein PHACADRAFT_264807 [Phanerochaete carnosa HHB-10118-sp]